MSEFEEFFKIKFPNIQATIDQTHSEESILLKKSCRIIWDARQAEIDQLKAQLNNMEACYIEKKKERKELHAVLKCVSEHFEMNDLDSCMPRVFEMIQEAMRGAND